MVQEMLMSMRGPAHNLIYTLFMLPSLAFVVVALLLSMMFLWNYERKLYR